MSRSVDYRETLVVYLRSNDMHDAAKTLGVGYATLYARIKWLRKAGVKVPLMRDLNRGKGGLGALEVAQLNSLINKHHKEVKASI